MQGLVHAGGLLGEHLDYLIEVAEGVDLPVSFTCPALDTDEANAAAAGHDLDRIERTIVEAYCSLELVERALRESEPHSIRAMRARAEIRSALVAFE